MSPARAHADPTWTLVWNDEFNSAANAPPDPTRWNYDLGGGGWGNAELETYTNATANCAQDGAGHLAVTAVDTAGNYTSARIKTETLFDQAYGRIEASIQIPWGVGIWPAFWMLGSNIATNTWPSCGEIDLMENIGQYDAANVIGGHIHGPMPGNADYNGGNGVGTNYTLPGGAKFTAAYHIFAAEWNPTQIVFYVDGAAYQTITAASLPAGGTWVFNHPFFILLNLAVGGTAGSPAATAFPQKMLVDYVRVYKLTDNGTAAYGGTPWAVPGVVQAENYDAYTDVSDGTEPGEGFAYNGLGPANIPGQYRTGDAVSVETCSDTGGGYDVTDTSPGQWQQYSVNAAQSGVYTLDARVAESGVGGTFHVDVDGNTVTGELSVPNTGAAQTWGDVTAGGITLSAGAHKVLLVEDSVNASGQNAGGFNYLSFSLPSPTVSVTQTATRTATETPSSSASESATPLASLSSSKTPSSSPTPSPSLSVTAASSPSGTQSPQASAGPSGTASPLSSGSPGPSASATASSTPTASSTGTSSSTVAPTATQQRTAGSAPTTSPSATAPASTVTSTPNASMATTIRSSDTVTQRPPGKLRGYPVPDPNPRLFKVYLSDNQDTAQIWIFTAAMTRVAVLNETTGQGPWVSLPLPPDFSSHAANGLYYYQLFERRGNAIVGKSGSGKFFILR